MRAAPKQLVQLIAGLVDGERAGGANLTSGALAPLLYGFIDRLRPVRSANEKQDFRGAIVREHPPIHPLSAHPPPPPTKKVFSTFDFLHGGSGLGVARCD